MADVFSNALSGVGDLFTGGAQGKAEKASKAADRAISGVDTPDIEEMRIYLENLVLQGELTPEEARSFLQNSSEMSNISLDPAYKQAQLEALYGLQEIADEGGLTPIDRARLQEIKAQEDTQARGSREAILQNAQSRGVGGSGVELMSQMKNQQDAVTRQSSRDLDVAALAQQRALEALMQGGTLAGQMEGNEFARGAQVAGAQDAINRFNSANMQNVELANVQARNAAAQQNLANKQNTANQNVLIRNAQEESNKGLYQQAFENEMGKATARANALNQQAAQYQTSADRNKATTGSVISAGAMGASGAGTPEVVKAGGMSGLSAPKGLSLVEDPYDKKVTSDRNLKEDIGQFDPSEFLDSLTSYKFHYKKPEQHGKGSNYGVMAQDLEKTPAGAAMVEDTAEGKQVDYGKGFGTLLAAMSDMHKRVKALEC